ncbi:hypothetical protein M8Z33_28200 [Streptomyces sp. ZAF1911]|uniref:hypothetical protein n=1 Tax=Streptomyces sp. ZAF1911 TaxID=2944129 RepID=UPI00237AC64C|nr:hypothetical protein [Streptomyces sp. ZAF1911]MDD9380469.1 hypothetical protein [Streptomyces sp. ZAF1911]
MKPTPTAQDWHAHYAAGRDSARRISLDDAEIALLTHGSAHTDRIEASGSTVLLLRGPQS